MKFTTRDHTPRPRPLAKAVEVLGTPEQPTEDFFDVRKFLTDDEGVEYLRTRVNASYPDEYDYALFKVVGWIGNLDQDIGEGLRAVAELKKVMWETFKSAYNSQGDLSLAQFETYILLVNAIQVFPELRQETRVQKLLAKAYPEVKWVIAESTIPLADRNVVAGIFSLLLPEHREELAAEFLKPFDGQPDRLFSDPEIQRLPIQDYIVLLFLFPELHDQIVSRVRPKMEELENEWKVVTKKRGKTTEELLEYFELAFILTMLTSEKVTISSEGKILFELKLPAITPPIPLPERPLN